MDNKKAITKTKVQTEEENLNSALDKFNGIINIVRFCSRFAGVDVLRANYKPNLLTYFVLVAIATFYVFSYLTLTKFIHDDWTIILDVFTTLGGCTQGLVKFITIWVYSKELYELYLELNAIYVKYQQQGNKYQRVLNKFGDKIKKVLVLVGAIYFITFSLATIIPIAILLYNGNRYLIILINVPGLDVGTDFGYFLTTGFHAMFAFIAGFGVYAGDTFVLIYLTHSLLFCEIYALKVEDLNNMIAEEASQDSNIFKALTDMLQWHQFYLRFNEICNHLFYWIVSVQIFGSALSIIMTIVIIMTKDWPGAYAMLLMSITALYIYCIMGTRIEICNDEFCDEIYNINWYGLSASQQKLVWLMLMRSQSPNTINVAGVMPLTVGTALSISKTIYSVFMMMLQFLD